VGTPLKSERLTVGDEREGEPLRGGKACTNH
jgi:hypothetical protein